MSRLFLKVYFSIFLSLSGLALLTFGSTKLVESARSYHYWEYHLGRPWKELLNQYATAEDAVKSLKKTGFEAFSIPVGSLGIYEQYRLKQRDVTSTVDTNGSGVLIIPHGDKAIHITMAGLFHKSWSRFVWWLITTSLPEFQSLEEKIKFLNKYLPFPVSVVYGNKQNDMFSDHPADKYLTGLRYIRITTPLYTVVMGPVEGAGFWDLASTISFVVLAMMLTALLVFVLIASLRTSLAELDQVTSRLAQGHLGARLPDGSSGPTGRLASSFNRMASRIQQLVGVQREMLRAVSHELRTPVARLRFGLQIIEDSTEDEFVKRRTLDLDNDINELDQLIDEILTYARLEDGGLIVELKPSSIGDIAQSVVNESKVLAKVNVVYTTPELSIPEIDLEEKYIHRAIQNLVSNACRYAYSTVWVSCSFNDSSCRVDVEDDGPGVPEEDRRKLFQAFTRLDDSRTRSTGGYGLGLSIVKRIADWHGGRVLVLESERLGGARFSLVIPKKTYVNV